MERYIRDNLLAGKELVDFWLKVFRGEPVMVKVTQLAPRRKDGKPGKVPYFIIEVPYFATVEDRLKAAVKLAERARSCRVGASRTHWQAAWHPFEAMEAFLLKGNL